ncbi:MAG: acyltransferase [Rikenellaceae bacterium]
MIQPLTSLRFFFAFMVFASHYKIGGTPIFEDGYIGVSFFFMLSGFILSYSYRNRLLEKKTSKTDFYIARFARIYPLHLIMLLSYVVLLFMSNSVNWSLLPLNLLLLQSFIPHEAIYFSFNAVSWSISDEMFFYLLFPFIIIFINKLKPRGKLLFISSILVLYTILTFVIPNSLTHSLFYISPIFRITDFIIGMMVFVLWEHSKTKYATNQTKATKTTLEIVALVVLGLFIYYAPLIDQIYKFGIYYWLPMSVIIFIFAQKENMGGYISDLLSMRWLVFLGEISFGFYMIHLFTLKIVDLTIKKIGLSDMPILLHFSITLISILVLSALSFLLFETPCNKYIKSKYRLYKNKYHE